MNNANTFLSNLRDFDAPVIEEEIIEDDIELEPPPPVFSEEEMETAKAIAHATGRNEGIQEERAHREQIISNTLHQISDSLSTLFAAEFYREKQYEEEAVRLGLEIIDILAPSLQSRLGNEALKQALRDVLKTQSQQSEVKIDIHPEMTSDIDKIIDEIWPDKDSAPRYRITANSELAVGACNISWKDGGMIRDPQKTAQGIKTVLETLLVDQILTQDAEQVKETVNSPLTNDQNNAINKDQSFDSSDLKVEDDSTGD